MVGANVLHDLHVEREQAPVARGGEPRRVPLLARLVRALHELGARLDPLHGPSQPIGEGRNEHVLGIDRDLRSEPSARVGREHPYTLEGQPEIRRDGRSERVRALVTGPHGEALAVGVERGAHRARLEGHRGHAGMREGVLHHHISLGEGLVDIADHRAQASHDVALALVDARRVVPHRHVGVHHRGEWLVVDGDGLARVRRPVGVGSEDGRDRLPDMTDLGAWEDVLRTRRIENDVRVRRLGTARRQRRVELGKIGRGER